MLQILQKPFYLRASKVTHAKNHKNGDNYHNRSLMKEIATVNGIESDKITVLAQSVKVN